MRHPLPDLGEWPELEWEQWRAAAETLHMWMQIVGKTRLVLTPVQNHWWNITFYLTARGLTAPVMPAGGGLLLDIEFDFISHKLLCRTNRGETRAIALRPVCVARFFAEFMDAVHSLGIPLSIDPMPVEVTNPIRFDLDTTHCAYDADAASRFWRVLSIADTLLKRFSTNFYGKISPVHFFWGSFDLAVTRFNGKRAPSRPAADSVQAEAYSHEVISAGFWPGNGGYGRAAFYAYAAPPPAGLDRCVLSGGGGFNPQLGEFVLDYDEARSSPDPAETVLQFLEQTYSAAADLAKWDRDTLDRRDDIARDMRLRNRQMTASRPTPSGPAPRNDLRPREKQQTRP